MSHRRDLTCLLLAIGLGAQAWAAELPSRARARSPQLDHLRSLIENAESAQGEGRLEEAESLYRQVLADVGGPERPSLLLARAVDGLADLCRAQRRLDEAETFYRRAAEMWESLLGPNQPRLATTLHNLGLVYLERDMLEEAEPTLARALAIWEESLGPESEQARLTGQAVRQVEVRRDERSAPGPQLDR